MLEKLPDVYFESFYKLGKEIKPAMVLVSCA